MKAIGLICEYNPFHNGHLYHLNKAKEMFPHHAIIVVLGGNFLQRGEPSIIDKWDKTKIALEEGVDLVVELPFAFATQSADIFAKGAIQILNHLHVDHIVFGSESNDVTKLIKMADTQINNPIYDKLVKQYLSEGINYPSALAKALADLLDEKISTPNDILGVAYIREIKKLNANIIPVTIQRTNDYHGQDLDQSITSATSIRKALVDNNDITNYVPEVTVPYLQGTLHFIEDYFSILKYQIMININHLNDYMTVDEGIENRIAKYIISTTSVDELIHHIKTKRYTYNKIRRMLTHIMCNFTKEESLKYQNIEYIRVLGFSKLGQTYLNQIKKIIAVPLLTNYQKELDLELRTTAVYASILNEEDKVKLIESEYKNKPIRK